MTVKSLFLVSLLFIGFSLQAQRGNFNFNPEERAQKETARMTTELTLSEAQVLKVGEVNLKYANKTSELFKAEDRTQMREQMQTLRAEKAEEIKKYLTARTV